MEGIGDELAGVPLVLPVCEAGGFEAREEGVTDRFVSTLRFLAGGAFFVVVAVPFFVLDGTGRFLGIVDSGAAFSVEGTGTDDSRSGE